MGKIWVLVFGIFLFLLVPLVQTQEVEIINNTINSSALYNKCRGVVKTNTLESGDNLIHGFTYYNGYLWASTRTNPVRILKIDPSTLSYERIVLDYGLNEGEDLIEAEGSIWIILYTSPSKIIKVNPETFNWEIAIDFNYGEIRYGGSLEYAFGYLWAGGYEKIARINLSNMDYVIYDYSSVVGYNQFHALVNGGGYLWASNPNAKKILRINPNNPLDYDYIYNLGLSISDDIAYANNHLYVGNELLPSYVYKIANDLTYNSTVATDTENYAMAYNDGKIIGAYVGTPGRLASLDLNLGINYVCELPDGFNHANEIAFDGNGHMYVTCWEEPAKIVKMRLDIPIYCSDGTPYGQCSVTKPLYCNNGILIDNCQICGCYDGQACKTDGICNWIPNITNIPDKKVSEDAKPPVRWIDLWQYASDTESYDYELNFYIESQSNQNLINCWIDGNRYITCGIPARRQSGYSDITVKVLDTDGASDIDVFRVNVLSPSITILIIPFDWDGSYQSYSERADEIASYFLERIPLSNCPEEFKYIKVREDEDYSWFYWADWRCRTLGTRIPFTRCYFGALQRIYRCAESYVASEDEEYDFVVGITDNDIALSDCNYNVAGWSDGEGHLPSVIAETTIPGIVAHELGHEFGLKDQYCDCSGTPYANYCGPTAPISPLRAELGCEAGVGNGCCENYGNGPYDPACGWCLGNYDRMWSLGIEDQRTTMSNLILLGETGHYDEYEYIHLQEQELPRLHCQTGPAISSMSMQTFSEGNESNFNLGMMLNIDKNDNVTLIGLNFTELESFEIESSGEYSLKILDQSNNTLYQKNFSVHFIVFSDPPTFVNESIIFEIFKHQDPMRKLEVYHNDNLIFSHDIPSFCNNNSVCEENENYISCSDCKTNAIDDICNRERGDDCDFDCLEGLDPDCVDLIIFNVSLNGNLSEGKETEIKMNISNVGIRNATFEIGLFSNSVLETNVNVNVSGDFSDIIGFNWTPQQGCVRDLIFSLDFTNIINEINETNNELSIENIIIGLSGDVVIDFKIDIFDLAKVGLCYGCSQGEGCWTDCEQADLNNDNIINIFDLATVGLNYGNTC